MVYYSKTLKKQAHPDDQYNVLDRRNDIKQKNRRSDMMKAVANGKEVQNVKHTVVFSFR